MKRILIIDTETTGLDPLKDVAIEVAVIVYSIEHATVISAWSSLIDSEGRGNPVENVNRIPVAALSEAPYAMTVWERVGNDACDAGAFLAHNADFDRSFVPEPAKSALPWICTMEDIQWPKQTRARPTLVGLALEHDLGVATAHRAMADCELIARLLTRAKELGSDLGEMMEKAMLPRAEFAAQVDYKDKELAKERGFHWIGEEKLWKRKLTLEEVEKEASTWPFPIMRVGEWAVRGK
jgi:DNA polymerase-3 subunit epsilon